MSAAASKTAVSPTAVSPTAVSNATSNATSNAASAATMEAAVSPSSSSSRARLVELPGAPSRGMFRTQLVALRHELAEHPLFDPDGLARLIDSHPRAALSVCGMSDRNDPATWTEGRLDGLRGEQILDALQRGRFWLNVRQIDRHQPRVRQIVDRLYDELREWDRELNPSWRNATLLISSPSAFVNFHLDIPCNLLWHLRGVKRLWVYPATPPVVQHRQLAATVAGEATEMLPYRPQWDRHAEVLDLHPGDAVSWPQHSPHRVDNLSGLNVSLSTEHLTRAARRRIRVLQANHFLRTRWGVSAWGDETARWAGAKAAGATAYLAIRKLLRRGGSASKGYPVTFQLDPDAADCRRPLAVEWPQL